MTNFFQFIYADSPVFFFWSIIAFLPALLLAILILTASILGKTRKANIHCKKCNALLNHLIPENTPTCPKCNTPLNKRRNIRIVSPKRKKLAFMSLIVLLTPITIGLAASWMLYNAQIQDGDLAKYLDNTQLYKQEHARIKAGNERRTFWIEAAKRLEEGRLSNAEIKQWNKLLDTWLQNQIKKYNSNHIEFYIIKNYIFAAFKANQIDDDLLIQFINATYGEPDRNIPPKIVDPDAPSPIYISIPMGEGYWYGHQELLPLFWHLTDLKLDNQPITAKDVHLMRRSHGQIEIDQKLMTKDKQTLTFTLVGSCVYPGMTDGFGYEIPQQNELLGVYHTITVPYTITLQKQ